jgi:hypothetical protein
MVKAILNDVCVQAHGRNQDGDDSLETAIRTRSTPESLPVFTIADAGRVVESMLKAILDIDNLRGTDRVWLP